MFVSVYVMCMCLCTCVCMHISVWVPMCIIWTYTFRGMIAMQNKC